MTYGAARRRSAVLLAAAVVTGSLLTACSSGGSGSKAAPEDAKAACAALSRSKDELQKPGAVTLKRLFGAANLGSAAAIEDNKKYMSLASPMNAVLSDVQTANTAKLVTDVRAALSVCSDLNLPH